MPLNSKAQELIYSQFADENKDHYDIVKWFEDFKDQFKTEYNELITGYMDIDSVLCFGWLVDILGSQVNLSRIQDELDSDFKIRIKQKRVITWLQPNTKDWYKYVENTLATQPDIIRVIAKNGTTGIYHNSDDISDSNEYFISKIRNGGSAVYMPLISTSDSFYQNVEDLNGTYTGIFNDSLKNLLASSSTEKILFEYAVFYATYSGNTYSTDQCIISKIEMNAGVAYCDVIINLENYSNNIVNYWNDNYTLSGNSVTMRVYNSLNQEYYIEINGTLHYSHSKHLKIQFALKNTSPLIQYDAKNLYEYNREMLVNPNATKNNFYETNKYETVMF